MAKELNPVIKKAVMRSYFITEQDFDNAFNLMATSLNADKFFHWVVTTVKYPENSQRIVLDFYEKFLGQHPNTATDIDGLQGSFTIYSSLPDYSIEGLELTFDLLDCQCYVNRLVSIQGVTTKQRLYTMQ